MALSDEALLQDSLQGQPQAFEELVRRYERRVYGLIHRLCGRPQEAQDLFQVVWMQAYAGRGSFQGRSSFRTWLYAITVNQVRDHRRRQAQEGRRRGEMPADASDLKPSFLDRLLKRDQEQQVLRALRRLSASDQEVLALHYLQDLGYREIAVITGAAVGPLRVKVHRALKRLKTSLEAHADQD